MVAGLQKPSMNPIGESDIEGIKQRIETAKKTRKEYEKKIEIKHFDSISKSELPFFSIISIITYDNKWPKIPSKSLII